MSLWKPKCQFSKKKIVDMEITTIIYIIIAFIVGGGLVFFLQKQKGNSHQSEESLTETLQSENDSLKAQLTTAESRLQDATHELSQKAEDIKSNYESLLKEAQEKCSKLDAQLKRALEGKVDDSMFQQLAEIDKLKKKIKDLEDELEENEDDISDLKKKVKGKDDEIAKQEENLRNERKETARLNEELANLQHQLNDKVKELDLKMGSLDFIQEILSAPDTNMTDIRQLYDNISEMKSFAMGQLMDCFATLKDAHVNFGEGDFDAFKKYWEQRFYEWASVTKKSWINGKTTIAFVGEFSAGKTSIVNRILSQDDPKVPQLPVSSKATTAVATYIAGGTVVSYQFVTPDDKLKTISRKTFTEKVSKEILDQVKGVSSLIQYFVMTYKNPNLNGLSILDTPGFNSNDKNDAQRTMEVINECDALFWVFDVNAGTINRSSLSVIKEHLNKPLYVVINKVDTKPDSEIKKVEDLIKKTLTNEGIDVHQYIRFSSKASLLDIMKPIREVQHLAEREQYINDLRNLIVQILDILNNQVKEANQKYRKAEAQSSQIDNQFIQQMRTLYSNCNTAVSIPHFEEHLFRKDNFEMSKEEYEWLRNVLDSSVNDVERMGSIYDKKTESAHEVQQCWSDLCDVKAAWQRLNAVQEQFYRISIKFK